ncbi:AI-2E family transporter, partial [Streptomyces eurythermus]
MARVPRWLGRIGRGLAEMSERLDERRAEVEKERDEPGPEPAAGVTAAEPATPPARRTVPPGSLLDDLT